MGGLIVSGKKWKDKLPLKSDYIINVYWGSKYENFYAY